MAERLKGEGVTDISTTTHNIVASLALTLEQERDRWLLWIPVFFGSGIGLYFALSVEPNAFLGVGVLLDAAIS